LTVKADAHFVDCDKADGPGGSWDSTSGNTASGNVAVWTNVNDVDFVHTPVPKHLNAGESAVEIDASTVAIRCDGHGFTAGQVVQFWGTSNYTDLYTVKSGTSYRWIYIDHSPFVSETFSGTETVVRHENVGVFTSGLAVDSSGNIMVGVQKGGSVTARLRKYQFDWTKEADGFFTPSGGWDTADDYACSCHISSDETYVYALILRTTFFSRLTKFRISDGAFQWATGGCRGIQSAIDSSDYVYVTEGDAGFDWPVRFDPSTGSIDREYTNVQGSDAICLDETLGMLFVGGQAGVDYAPSWYNITRVNIDGTGIIKADLSNTTNGNRIWKILSDGLNVYALGDNANSGVGGALANIWKLDSSLNLVASAHLENAVSMFFDANGDIVVMQNSNNISGETAQYNVYNTSLVLQNSYFVQGPGVNNPVISLNSYVPDSGFVFSGSSSENEQSRTVAYPQDWAHIEGQTVQILGDGEYLDDQTYTISSGQVSCLLPSPLLIIISACR
jgi:hypothetical protein